MRRNVACKVMYVFLLLVLSQNAREQVWQLGSMRTYNGSLQHSPRPQVGLRKKKGENGRRVEGKSRREGERGEQ